MCGSVVMGDKLIADDITKALLIGQLLHSAKNSKDSQIREASITVTGQLAAADENFPSVEVVLDVLCGTQREKSPDLHFTVGRALARIGSNSSLHISHEENSGTADNSVMDVIISKIVSIVESPAPPVRQAAAIWLMSLVKYAPHHPAVQARLLEIQSAFSLLLGDFDEFTQECASNGLRLVYECGSESIRSTLTSSLMSTMAVGTKQQTVSAETQVFAPEMGKTPSGESLTTYKDLCGLASELNKPELVYKFMALSKHNALWNSRKGAAFGFASIANMTGEQLKPHLPVLVPKLYRYRHDPSTGTRQAMLRIWKALPVSSNSVVVTYAKEILADLEENMTSIQWRTREASCLALADFTSAMQTDIGVDSLTTLWPLVFQRLDDIKETVRKAAMLSATSLANVTKKLCDAQTGTNADVNRQTLSVIMPLLMDQGLHSKAKDIQSLCLQMLQDISQVAGAQLKPYVTDIVVVMLEWLSEAESSTASYLSFHLDKLNVDAEQFDDARVAASKSSPISETIELALRHVDSTVLDSLIPRLVELLRGVGLQTKAGTMQVLATIGDTQTGPGLGRHSKTVLKALRSALLDNSPAVRKGAAVSLSYVIKTAQDSDVEILMTSLERMAIESCDETQQQASGYACLQISQHAPNQMKRFSTNLLPVAYVAMHQDGPSSAVWATVWEENTPGTATGLRLYTNEIVALLVAQLQSSAWQAKGNAAKAITDMANAVSTHLAPFGLQLLAPLVQSMGGRYWQGKENVLDAVAAVTVTCAEGLEKDPHSKPSMDDIVAGLAKEAKKKALDYRQRAVEALGTVLQGANQNRYEQVEAVLFTSLLPPSCDDEDSDEDVSERQHRAAIGRIQGAAAQSLAYAFPSDYATQAKYGTKLLKAQVAVLEQSEWPVKIALLKAIRLVFSKFSSGPSGEEVLDRPSTTQLIETLVETWRSTSHSTVKSAVLGVVEVVLTAERAGQCSLSESAAQRLDEIVQFGEKDVDGSVRAAAIGLKRHKRKL